MRLLPGFGFTLSDQLKCAIEVRLAGCVALHPPTKSLSLDFRVAGSLYLCVHQSGSDFDEVLVLVGFDWVLNQWVGRWFGRGSLGRESRTGVSDGLDKTSIE